MRRLPEPGPETAAFTTRASLACRVDPGPGGRVRPFAPRPFPPSQPLSLLVGGPNPSWGTWVLPVPAQTPVLENAPSTSPGSLSIDSSVNQFVVRRKRRCWLPTPRPPSCGEDSALPMGFRVGFRPHNKRAAGASGTLVWGGERWDLWGLSRAQQTERPGRQASPRGGWGTPGAGGGPQGPAEGWAGAGPESLCQPVARAPPGS